MNDDTQQNSNEDEKGGAGNGGQDPNLPKPNPQEPKPDDCPPDELGTLCYAIAELIQDEAKKLKKGDCQDLCEFVSYAMRLVKDVTDADGNKICDLEAVLNPPPTACYTCAQCVSRFSACTGGYTYCKAQYDICVKCPCR